MTKFGEFIRNERKEKGISLREFAREVGVSSSYVSNMERGFFKAPSEDKIDRMADVLDIDPDFLLAKAGKISGYSQSMYLKNPVKCATILAATRDLTENQLQTIIEFAIGMQIKNWGIGKK